MSRHVGGCDAAHLPPTDVYLLDTNVVSELRKIRLGKADPHVAQWADSVDAGSLHISAITVLELEIGILQIEQKSKGKAERNDRLFAVPRRSHSEQGLPCAQ